MKNLIAAMLGLALGLGGGLFYAWSLNPVAYRDTEPVSLRADYKAAYLRLIAQAYVVDGDGDRARARLATLGESYSPQHIAALAQQAAAKGEEAHTVRALAALASALGAGPMTATPVPTPSVTPTVTNPPPPTNTPRPTVTPYLLPTAPPTLTPPGAFGFSGKQLICDAHLKPPLLQVLTLGADGAPVPGVEVMVKWSEGSDHFYTGLKAELGEGYGDFAMTPGVDYLVYLAADPSLAVAGLTAEPCIADNGQPYPGSWQVVFSQPQHFLPGLVSFQ